MILMFDLYLQQKLMQQNDRDRETCFLYFVFYYQY